MAAPTFYIPTKVFFEGNAVSKHMDLIDNCGQSALIVTGKSSYKNGALRDVTDTLIELGKAFAVFDETEENPTLACVERAVQKGKQHGVDFVIAVGGGSVMDLGKAVSLLLKNPQSPSSVLFERIKLENLPIVCIPTTCGTGSEVTPYAVFTRMDTGTKSGIGHFIYPDVALLDIAYLRTLPHAVLCSTVADALGHCVESYLNAQATVYSRMICAEALRVLSNVVHPLTENRITDDVRWNLMRVSNLAGMAIAHTGTGVPHLLSYKPTVKNNVPHGKAVGYYLPPYLTFFKKYSGKSEDVEKLMSILGFETIAQFSVFLQKLLGSVDTSNISLSEMKRDLQENPRKLASVPFAVEAEKLEYLLNEIEMQGREWT